MCVERGNAVAGKQMTEKCCKCCVALMKSVNVCLYVCLTVCLCMQQKMAFAKPQNGRDAVKYAVLN